MAALAGNQYVTTIQDTVNASSPSALIYLNVSQSGTYSYTSKNPTTSVVATSGLTSSEYLPYGVTGSVRFATNADNLLLLRGQVVFVPVLIPINSASTGVVSKSSSLLPAGTYEILSAQLVGPACVGIDDYEGNFAPTSSCALSATLQPKSSAPATTNGLPNSVRMLQFATFDRLDGRLSDLRFANTGDSEDLFRQNSYASLDNITGMGSSDAQARHGFWARTFGNQDNQGSHGDFSGYVGRGYGITGGYDLAVNSRLTVGAAFTTLEDDLHFIDAASGQTAKIGDNQLSTYGSYDFKPVYVDWSGGFAWQRYDTSRPSSTANSTATFKGNQWSAHVGSGWPLALSSSVAVVPQVGLDYSKLHEFAYTETGGDSPMTVYGKQYETWRTGLGAQINDLTYFRGVAVQPFAKLTWHHNFNANGLGGIASDATGSPLAYSTQALPANTIAGEIGAQFSFTRSLSAAMGYSLESAVRYKSQTAKIGLRYSF